MQKRVIAKNSIIGIVSQLSKILFTFITRSIFLKYLGKELLGLNSTFVSVLGTLAVTELGFQTAIAYSLYQPIYDDKKDVVNDIVNILRIVYRGIGILFISLSFALIPFLKYIITGIEVTNSVIIYFLLQSAASSCTYFLAYKRTLLYADQKEYVSKIIDTLTNIVFNVALCISIILVKSYIVYLIICIAQVITSNIIIHLYCLKHYTYLSAVKFNNALFKDILGKVKHIFASKIAGYVYSSTDNIVVSVFVNTVSVGFLVNYTTITNSLKSLIGGLIKPITPVIGNFLVGYKDGYSRKEVFDLYNHIMFLIAICTVIPLRILLDDFITWWVGSEMVLEKIIAILVSLEFYIHLIHSGSTEFINGGGFFKEDRNIEIMGAAVNLFTSLILVKFFGIAGVLMGTVMSQVVLWIGRSNIVFTKCFQSDRKSYVRYWFINSLYILTFLTILFLCEFIYTRLPISNAVVKMIVGLIFAEVIGIILSCTLFLWSKEQKRVNKILRNTITGFTRRYSSRA